MYFLGRLGILITFKRKDFVILGMRVLWSFLQLRGPKWLTLKVECGAFGIFNRRHNLQTLVLSRNIWVCSAFRELFKKKKKKSHGSVSSSCHHFFPYFYHVDLGDNIQLLFNGEVTATSFSPLSRCECVSHGTINIGIAGGGRSTDLCCSWKIPPHISASAKYAAGAALCVIF